MQLHIHKDSNELSKSVAEWMAEYISSTLKNRDRFTLVLSGGSTPQQLHRLLAHPPYSESINWNKLHIFWGDERWVPFEDERNNAKMAYDSLLNHVPVPANQIHIMQTGIEPEDSASDYE